MIYRFLSLCTDGACKKAKETSVIGEFVQSFMPPLCKGRGTTKWWKGFASVRSTLAGLAERGSETAQRLEVCKKTIPHRLRRSSLYTREP